MTPESHELGSVRDERNGACVRGWLKGAALIVAFIYLTGLLLIAFGVALTLPLWIWWVA